VDRGPLRLLSLGAGLEVALLPRPAFIEDLAAAAKERPGLRPLIIVDDDTAAAQACLDQWLEVFAMQQKVVLVPAQSARPLGGPDAKLRVMEAPSVQGTEAAHLLAELNPPPDLVVTCEPYDPYGRLVKEDLESTLCPLIERWNALFLVHDANYRTLRCYSPALLRDRLVRRPRRLWWYRRAVYLLFHLAKIFSKARPLGWRTVGRS